MIDQFKENENLELETRFMGKNFKQGKLDYKKYTDTLNFFIKNKEEGGLGFRSNLLSELLVFDDYDTNASDLIFYCV